MFTLRHAAEIRQMLAIDKLDQVPDPVNEAEVALARQVIWNFARELDLNEFTDEYQAELRRIIDAKVPEEEAPARVVDLMDALRKSLDSVSKSKKKPAKATKVSRATARQRAVTAASGRPTAFAGRTPPSPGRS